LTSISRIQRPLKACFRLLYDDDDDDDEVYASTNISADVFRVFELKDYPTTQVIRGHVRL